MSRTFRVTYDLVTPESIEHGDREEGGFVAPGGWRQEEPVEVSLREAIRLIGYHYSPGRPLGLEDSGSGRFSTTEPVHDRAYFEKGHEVRFSIHPPKKITPSSLERVARILVGRK